MQLLVSVRDTHEAAAALAGGADVIDAKDPHAGALGAVSLETLHAIAAAVARARPLTAALGDASTDAAARRDAAAFTAAGAALVKIGFAGTQDPQRVAALIRAAAEGAGAQRLIAVAYADHTRVAAPAPAVIAEAASAAGIAGVLLDTADKQGPGLPQLISAHALHAWIASARDRGLLVALAGKVEARDLDGMRGTGAQVVGVRGAACEGGRSGCITSARVRLLRARLGSSTAPDARLHEYFRDILGVLAPVCADADVDADADAPGGARC